MHRDKMRHDAFWECRMNSQEHQSRDLGIPMSIRTNRVSLTKSYGMVGAGPPYLALTSARWGRTRHDKADYRCALDQFEACAERWARYDTVT